MEIKQLAQLTNDVVKEVLGETAVTTEDLENVVDLGKQIFDANAVDNYVKTLINHIGKVVFVNRKYTGAYPSLLMDGWEFGSVLEKITMEKLPDATDNESWELVDGQVYEQDTFYKPSIVATFYNSKTTFEIPISITEVQVKESFSNVAQLNGFVSMIFNAIEQAMTIRNESIAMRTINNFIGETLYNEVPSGVYSGRSGTKAVNLLYLYNQAKGQTLTKDKALYDLEFLKFASMTIGLYVKRLGKMSTLFNIDGKERFTPEDKLHIALLTNFVQGANSYLQSDTFHNEMTALPKKNVDEVVYWQGTGVDYALDSVSKIDIKTSGGHEIEIDYVIGVMYDRDACGIANANERVRSHVNDKAEFMNYWFKRDCSYFNSTSENFVVFYLA